MWREEWHKEKFKLEYERPEDFTRCLCQKTTNVLPIWIAYRLVIFLIFTALLPCVIFLSQPVDYVWYKNILYVSSLNAISQVLVYGILFGITVAQFVKEKKDPELAPMEKMPWHYKTLWIFYETLMSTSVLVCFMFWFFIYGSKEHSNGIVSLILCRFGNYLLVIVDFLVSAIPYRFLHFYVPCVCITAYVLLTCIYQFSGGTGNRGQIAIYTVWDWRTPEKIIAPLVVTLVCSCLCHFAFYTIHLLKLWFKKWLEDRRNVGGTA